MVDDSKKRGRGGQRGGHTPAVKGRQSHGGGVVAADQDAFAAFTAKYRDMLRFADADEAEAVYSMVSLTQAAAQQADWQHTNPADIKGPVIEVPESRAVKRRPITLAVPASSACSEGGRSDSSAKSAPGPTQHLQQQWHSLRHQGPSMLAAALGPPGCSRQVPAAPQQQQQAAAQAGPTADGMGTNSAAAVAGDIHPGALGPAAVGMNMNAAVGPMMGAAPFFPPGCMPGMLGGCPPGPCMPFMAPWGMMPPAMMQQMMFGGLPLPPLPMPPPGLMLLPFMTGGMMPPQSMMMQQGFGAAPQPCAAAGVAAEPAAGIPVSGPLPPAGNAFKAAAASGSSRPVGPPSSSTGSKGVNTPAAAAAAPAASGRGAHVASISPAANTPTARVHIAPQQQQGPTAAAPRAATPPAGAAGGGAAAAAAAAVESPAGDSTPTSVPSECAAAAAAAAAAPPSAGAQPDLLAALEALDVTSLRPWVLEHFCENVYLLLLDAWRPSSPMVREAIWAARLHINAPLASGAAPDYRAFLVSLFGLDKLTQLTAAHRAQQGSSSLTKVASYTPAAETQQHQMDAGTATAAGPPCCPAAAEASLLKLAHTVRASGVLQHYQELACSGEGDGAECDVCTPSNLSSEPGGAGATLSAPGPHVMSILVPPTNNLGASATSPHRATPAQLTAEP